MSANSVIKLSTTKEFDDFIINYGNLPRFSPNRVEFNKNQYYILNGRSYETKQYSHSFVEDFFHPGYYTSNVNANTCIITSFSLTGNSDEELLDPNDESTYMSYTVETCRYTEDLESRELSCNKVMLYDNNCIFYTNATDEILKNNGFRKGKINSEIWFYRTEIDYLDKNMPYRKFNNIYKNIDINQRKEELKLVCTDATTIQKELDKIQKDNMKFGTFSPTFKGLEGITNTFGIELESIAGRLVEGEELDLNLKTVHDGSLRLHPGEDPSGAEYVSGVLVGDTGLAQVYNICKILSKRCKLNHQCGYHVHIGGLNWSKEDIVYSYILAQKIEDELFSILPKSRRGNEYCRNLTTIITKLRYQQLANASKKDYDILIDDIYNDILIEATFPQNHRADKTRFLASASYSKSQQHPAGAKCGYNKAYQRYCWLNYITLLYNTKGAKDSHTLEIRSHSGTFNYTKVKNWLKICLAFCKFVENHKSLILKTSVTLEVIINSIFPKTGSELLKYINERKEVFKTHDESIDYINEEHSVKSLKEVVCA